VNDHHLLALLAGRYIATLGTRCSDGSIHLSVVWFLYLDETILIATSGTTRKARNAARRPHGSVLIDARGPADLRGVAATGELEILTGATAQQLNEKVWRKYLTAEGLEAPELGGTIRANDDVTIRFTPDRWRTWGTDTDFGGAFGSAGMSFPLDV
jgi:PPOX class probable F420-dependent enzyme